MVSVAASLGLKEAAVIAGVDEKRVRREVEQRVLLPARGRHSLPPEAAVFLRIIEGVPVALDPDQRRALYELLVPSEGRGKRNRRIATTSWRRDAHGLTLMGDVPVSLSVQDVEREISERLRVYLRGRGRVVRDDDVLGGTEVFQGTRVPVAHVGALVKRGVAIDELLEDYPSLSVDDIRYAEMHVALGRRPGRPRRKARLRVTARD